MKKTIVAIGLVLFATTSSAQVFDPTNLAEIETEFSQALPFVSQALQDDSDLGTRRLYAQLVPGWTTATLPTCDALKQPIFDVPAGASYTLQSLGLNSLGPFRCNFSLDQFLLPTGVFPANVGFMFHCSCLYQGNVWRKTERLIPGSTIINPIDGWYVFDDLTP